jgi:hypothetical protein
MVTILSSVISWMTVVKMVIAKDNSLRVETIVPSDTQNVRILGPRHPELDSVFERVQPSVVAGIHIEECRTFSEVLNQIQNDGKGAAG